jgi:hypothetical protein
MTSRPWAWLTALLTVSCASAPAKNAEEKDVAVVRHVDKVTGGATTATLAGARGQGRKTCSCRVADNEAETDPPPEGKKRIEIRLAADGGSASLDGGLGHFEAFGPQESCFYVDVPAGQTKEVSFLARADKPAYGVAPRFRMAEYGPKGPFWYAIIDVECKGQQGRCDRQGADAWAARNQRDRKRGRLDPCGSAVVSKLAWDASGGEHDRDGGLFRDLTVRFALEVKKFATQFAPGSTECVPK